ncbi:hypothetical protein [Bremerella cremea]|uniref:hypothetical protein n=1 Tax=Bremerella cremea TaxID=1031537 RepID=UPI0031EFEF97
MPFSLDQVVPWGRSWDEYLRMFAIDDRDLQRKILGCADGPAAFQAEANKRGVSVISCDPLYAFSAAEIESRIDACFETVLQQTERNQDGFIWNDAIPNVAQLGHTRREAMQTFLADFPAGKQEGRYIAAELPDLPFPADAFDLALCSHFLFLYDSLGVDFHVRSARSLLAVAQEVRIFPLLQLDRQRSPFVDVVTAAVQADGHHAEVIEVDYEFQKGASQMLRLTRAG